MQFEDFDKKVREAAEHHHPAYDEKAWKNMEKLLDKHLPTEKKDDKRRFLFFLLLFLIAGTGVYLWATSGDKPTTISESGKQATEHAATVTAEKESAEKTSIATSTGNENKADKSTVGVSDEKASTLQNSDNNIPFSTTIDQTNKSVDNSIGEQADESDKVALVKKLKSGNSQGVSNNSTDGITARSTKVKKNNSIIDKADNKNADLNTTEITASISQESSDNKEIVTVASPTTSTVSEIKNSTPQKSTDTSAVKEEDKPLAKAETKKPAPKPLNKSRKSFAITISGGPDVSTVGISSIGKMNCVIGAGLSYTYNRFTLRSGFYAVKKVYSATPDDYNPPQHYWTNYVNLTKVDGSCKVFEIPVTLGYNFVQKNSHSIFGAFGVSSFIMKKETYEYYYKNQSGVDQYRSWSTTGNKNLFSVIDISAGYEKRLNRGLSLTVEPYLKVPMSGIGFGKVQLNSMGVLITMNIKPFEKK